MPFTNFPGGVSSMGIPMAGQGSLYDMPPGKVWFVCNRTAATSQSATTGTTRDAPFLSIADAVTNIATTNPTLGDTIYVMAGHAENVTGSNIFSASLVNTTAVVIPAGTRIIGEGFGTQRPTLTFTAAASTIAFAAAGCSIENMIFQCPQTGTTTVAAMVTTTAAGCMVRQVQFQLATSATALVTTGISLSAAASDFAALDNMAYTTTGTPTSWLSTTGTVGPKRVTVSRNFINTLLTATTSGCIDVSANSGTAPTDWYISDNTLANLTASSTVCIRGCASWTGAIAYNNLIGLTTTNLTTTLVNTPGNIVSLQNFVASPHTWGIVGGSTNVQTS